MVMVEARVTQVRRQWIKAQIKSKLKARMKQFFRV